MSTLQGVGLPLHHACETYMAVRQAMFNAAGRDARKLGKLLSTVELIPHLFQFIKTMERLRLSRERTTEA